MTRRGKSIHKRIIGCARTRKIYKKARKTPKKKELQTKTMYEESKRWLPMRRDRTQRDIRDREDDEFNFGQEAEEEYEDDIYI